MPQHIPVHDSGDEIEIRIDGFHSDKKGTMRRTIKQLVNARIDTATEEHRHEQILRNPPRFGRMPRGRLTFRSFRKLLEWDDVVFLWKFEELTADNLPGCEIHVHCEGITDEKSPLVFSTQEVVNEHLIELSLAGILRALTSTVSRAERDAYVGSLQFVLRCPGGGPRGDFVITRVETGSGPEAQPLSPPMAPMSQVPTGA